jgi:hypothetical protein
MPIPMHRIAKTIHLNFMSVKTNGFIFWVEEQAKWEENREGTEVCNLPCSVLTSASFIFEVIFQLWTEEMHSSQMPGSRHAGVQKQPQCAVNADTASHPTQTCVLS